MDHHCRILKCTSGCVFSYSIVLHLDSSLAWIFNCVGHYNHRYFILFIVFMWLGTAFMSNCLWRRALFYLNGERVRDLCLIACWQYKAISLSRQRYQKFFKAMDLWVLCVVIEWLKIVVPLCIVCIGCCATRSAAISSSWQSWRAACFACLLCVFCCDHCSAVTGWMAHLPGHCGRDLDWSTD